MQREEQEQGDQPSAQQHRSSSWSGFLEGTPSRREALPGGSEDPQPRAPERIGLSRVPDALQHALTPAARERDATPSRLEPVPKRPTIKNDRVQRIFAFTVMALLAVAVVVVRVENDAIAAIFQLNGLTQQASLTNGLVGWWTFDGRDLTTTTATDRSGQGNNGTLVSSPLPVPGKIGQAIQITTSSQYVNAGTPASLNNIQKLTVAFWARGTGNTAPAGRAVDKFYWNLDLSSGLFSRAFSGGTGFWGLSSSFAPQGEWHHYVITYDDSSTANDPTFYIDGNATSSSRLLGPSGSASNDASIELDAPSNSFRGSIDDVRIYNRILSPQEIKYLYSYGQVKIKSTAGGGPAPTPVTLDGPANNTGYFIDLAIGADGFPVVSYYDSTAESLKLYKCNDVACSSGTASTLDPTDGNAVGWWTSIAIGRDGFPVISYYNNNFQALKFYKCNNIACSSGTASILDDEAGTVGEFSSIAIGSDGDPVISYADEIVNSLKFYKCNNAACTTGTASTLDHPANQVGTWTSIAIGRDGFPVISYRDATAFSLKFYKCNDVACSSGTASTLDGGANHVGFYTSIAIGLDGYPVISYRDTTGTALKLYKCNDAACASGTARTLDSSANVGGYTSIAIGLDGFPVISYQDNTALSLKFYKCNNTACSSGTASTLDDPTDTVGLYSSIARGVDGFPVISYQDSTAGTLKFLHCNGYCGSITTIGKSQESLVKDGLVGYWSFNGKNTHWNTNTTDDLSGQGNTGTMVNMSMSSSPVAGKVGQGLKFTSVGGLFDPYISIGTPATLNNLSALTISAWIKPKTLSTVHRIADKNLNSGGSGASNGWYFTTNGSAIWFEVGYDVSAIKVKSNSGALATNEWQHVVVTWDGSSSAAHAHIYINDVEVSYSATIDGSAVRDDDSAIALGIGENIHDLSSSFDGAIDEVRIYNKILSASEIQQLYNAGR